jgi:hypothetical protein
LPSGPLASPSGPLPGEMPVENSVTVPVGYSVTVNESTTGERPSPGDVPDELAGVAVTEIVAVPAPRGVIVSVLPKRLVMNCAAELLALKVGAPGEFNGIVIPCGSATFSVKLLVAVLWPKFAVQVADRSLEPKIVLPEHPLPQTKTPVPGGVTVIEPVFASRNMLGVLSCPAVIVNVALCCERTLPKASPVVTVSESLPGGILIGIVHV